MKNTIFSDDYVTMIICDHSNNAELYADNIAREFIFDETHFVTTMGTGDSRNNLQKLEDFVSISFSKRNRYLNFTDCLVEKRYDEIIVYNYTIETYGIYSILSRFNKSLKISRYEEGIFSYNGCVLQTKRRRLISFLRKAQKKPAIDDHFDRFYCLYPVLYKDSLKPYNIPLIEERTQICDVIKKVFDVLIDENMYKEKYIFFTSIYDFEGGEPIGEFELVCRVAEVVGKDNLLIKTHPRDARSIYADNGFIVDRNSSIPWEAIQLSGHFCDKTFLTVNSGSVLSGSTMSISPVKTVFLYKMCKYSNNVICRNAIPNIERTILHCKELGILKNVTIAEKLEDIL